MDNTDPEIEFHIGHGDHREPVESPRRNVRGHSEDREHDNLSKRHGRCCYGPPRPSIVIKPDSFTGDEDWEQYLSHFEDCAELGQWTDKEMLLTLAASLKGQARAFYTSLASADKCSYERLTMSLEQRFGSARQQARWLSKFQSRSKLYGESIANFGDDLRLLARKAYSNLEPEAQEILALQQFYKALSVEMRCRVIDRDCKTVMEAVEVVERYEELLGDGPINGKRRDIVRQTCDDYRASGFEQMGSTDRHSHDEEIHKTLKEIQSRLDRIEKGQKPRQQNGQRACFLCQSPDHLIRNCPHRIINGGESQERSQANKKSGNGAASSL
jgi:hypothetical protein